MILKPTASTNRACSDEGNVAVNRITAH